MKISELGAMEVDVEVNESDIVKVALGDTARIEVDAYTERNFYGMVTEIGNTALNATGAARLSLESVTNFSVKIRILPTAMANLRAGRDSSWTPFRPGMSATVEIETEVKTQCARRAHQSGHHAGRHFLSSRRSIGICAFSCSKKARPCSTTLKPASKTTTSSSFSRNCQWEQRSSLGLMIC